MSSYIRSNFPELSKSVSALGAAFATVLALFISPSPAQTSPEQMRAHPEYTASNYLAYPEPEKNVRYTRAPAGYKPFYISHYGRHGSRYHHSADDYNYLLETLQKADSAQALTLDGKRLLIAAQLLAKKAAPRAGDLTQAGVSQHQGIARRMVKNFPDIFKAGKAKGSKAPRVDAFSSTSGRCIVSMAAFAQAMGAVAPQVEFRFDSGKDLMSFICTYDWGDMEYTRPEAYTAESEKLWAAVDSRPLMLKLFNDTAYAGKNIDMGKFYNKLFEIKSSMQGMDAPLKETLHANLCDVKTGKCSDILDSLFTVEESITRWKAQNAWWYSLLGTSPLQNTTKGIDYARGTLENIIGEANRAIATGTTAATLRFGHDTGILPLAGLMQLSVASAKVEDLSKLDEQWNDFRIIPMAANLQIVFYKKPGASSPSKNKGSKKIAGTDTPKSEDILVKFLYNEREVTAPIPCEADSTHEGSPEKVKSDAESKKPLKGKAKKPVSRCPAAPYYRWSDVKTFYKEILDRP